MQSAPDEPDARTPGDGEEEPEEEDASCSKAEPYRMGRRLLIGSGGPTISAPGRAAKREDRRDTLDDEEAVADEEATAEQLMARLDSMNELAARERALATVVGRIMVTVLDEDIWGTVKVVRTALLEVALKVRRDAL